jgi:hypothetical protein
MLRESQAAGDNRRQVAGRQSETGAAVRMQPVAQFTNPVTQSAFTLQYDSGNRVLIIIFSADAIEPAVLLGRAAMERFIEMNGPCLLAMDFRLARSLPSAGLIRHLADMPRLNPPGWRQVAIVSRAAQFGVLRQLQIMRAESDGADRGIVYSDEEAWKFLGIRGRPQFAPVEPEKSASGI